MFAKGGKVEKEPKGMMVIIGVGKPKPDAPMEQAKGGKVAKVMHEFGEGKLHSGSKEGPKVTNPKQAVAIALNEAGKSKKSRGGIEYIDNGPDTSVPVKGMKGTKKQSTDEDFYGKAKDAPMPPRRPSNMKKGGYAEGGKAVKVPLPAEDEAPYPAQWPMPSDEQINKENWNQRKAIRRAMGAKNTGKDTFAKGGMTHDDAAQDKAMIKSMVKPAALKKAMGGPAVQMAKSNAIEASLKGQKKTGYADGGPMKHPPLGGTPASPDKMGQQYTSGQGSALQRLAASARQNVSPDQMTQMADAQRGKAALAAAQASQATGPLQQMGRSVPVAPRAPMIEQQAAPAGGGPRIGVGRSRSGKPDVGAIRAAMARRASQAMPENAPNMMKKGGKVGC
jgi:hypothetical protein